MMTPSSAPDGTSYNRNRLARRDLSPFYVSSVLIVVFTTVSSILGLLNPSTHYPTEDLRLSFVPNDVANVVIGAPALLTCAFLAAHQADPTALLLWPGALSYAAYASLTYAIAVPPGTAVFALQLSAAVLSFGTTFGVCAAVDGDGAKAALDGREACQEFGGVALAVWGGLFSVRAIAVLIGSDVGAGMNSAEYAIGLADMVVSPAWIMGGVALYHRTSLGYAVGPGLLFQACALFTALLAILLLQPFIAPNKTFNRFDFFAVAGMGLTVFYPFWHFLRVAARDNGLYENKEE